MVDRQVQLLHLEGLAFGDAGKGAGRGARNEINPLMRICEIFPSLFLLIHRKRSPFPAGEGLGRE